MTARDAWGQVAHDLRALAESIDAAIEQPVAGPSGPSDAPPRPAPAAPLPPKRQDASGFTKCPAHAKPWKDSKFPDGPGYCTAQSDDPEWSRNGYCSVTERSAAAWVRKHPPQVAAQPMDDDSDLPF